MPKFKVERVYWLMKSEPEAFSIDDLAKAKNKTSPWDGVRNYKARNYIKDMKIGDYAFFYHSSCKLPAIVGIVEIVSSPYPDPSAWRENSPYFDPKSTPANPRWFMVDVTFKKKFKEPILLQDLRQNPKISDFTLLKKGNRLSILPVTQQQWQSILAMIHEQN
ncbi:MAG: EVE domain-containing protein [Proteobacteria bacterium]|nr:EVE domain-containing protein [Pseudomonadota bacterium]